MASNNPDLTAVIDGDSKGLVEALGKATDELKNFENTTGASLRRVEEAFTGAFGNIEKAIGATKTVLSAAAPVLIFNLLHSGIQKGIDEFKKIGDAADKASVSTDFFQTLAHQATTANVQFDKVKNGLETFATGLSKLKTGQGDLKDHMEATNKALLDQLKGAKDGEAGVKLMADAIARLKSPFDQAKLASQAFGKSNADIAKVLNEGSDGLRRAGDEARQYSGIIDENVIRHSQNVKSGFADLSNVIDHQFKQALLNISPVIKDIGQGMLGLSGIVRQTYDAFSSLEGVTSTGLNERIKSVADTLIAQRDAIKKMQSGTEGTFDHNVIQDWLFGTNEEQLARMRENAESTLQLLNRLNAERAKRDAGSRTAPLEESTAKDTSEEDAKKLAEGRRAVDELFKRYYTDSHQYYLAIQTDAQREVERFKILLEDKKITAQQYSIAMITIAADEAAKIKAEQDKLATTLKSSMQSVSGEFEKIFKSWQDGHRMTVKQIEIDFIKMIENVAFKAAVLQPLFGGGGNSTNGGNSLGLIGGAIQKGTSGLDLGKTFAGIFHKGGIAGDASEGRSVSSSVFAGAHRYHQGGIAGLMPGEVPAILQEGERIIPNGQQGQGGASQGRGGHVFNVNIAAPTPQAFSESAGQIHTVLSQAVAHGERNL